METPSCVIFLKNIVEIEKTDYDLRTALIPFLSENTLDKVVAMLQKYPIHLTITPCVSAEESVQGSFRKGNIYKFGPHIIHIKNNLGKDSFLQTFLHEYAHLLTFLTFPNAGHHDDEFHFCFCKLLREFYKKNIISYFEFKGSLLQQHKDLYIYTLTPDWAIDEFHNKILDLISKKFFLKTIRVGSQFEYKGEVFVRGKSQQGKIRCMRLSDNMVFRFDLDAFVEPVLDLWW